MKYSVPPVWTTTGPATKTIRWPRPLVERIKRGDARDACLDAPLRRDLVRHEREVGAIALAKLGRHAQALEAADDAIPDLDFPQLAADRAPVFEHDHRIHALLARRRSIAPRHAPAYACWSSNRNRPGRSHRGRRSRTSASCSSTGWQPNGIRSSTRRWSAGQGRTPTPSGSCGRIRRSCGRSETRRPRTRRRARSRCRRWC